ncbi:Histone deacetylase 2 [Entophlyctis luteolus]|nr:Histone deacetylase 2 [Entophlyctis luteolus]
MKPARVRMTHSLITAYGLQRKMAVETFAFSMFMADGAMRLNSGRSDIAINWAGGLHHAKKSEASGFCYVNDIVLAILELLKVHERVVYIDTDVHHGDGVEEAFFTTDRVMTVSFHKFGEFFPGTGDVNDIGFGKGKHYSVNVPLNDGIDDDSYHRIFTTIMKEVMTRYRPGAIVLQLGADSLIGDRLGCFNLSMSGHGRSVTFMKSFGVPLILLGGGGYTIRNVAKAWCHETTLALGVEVAKEIPYHDYFEGYGPTYLLDIPASNMENLNSRKYLDQIQTKILESLRQIPHVPSVQSHHIPIDDFSCSDNSDEDEIGMNQLNPDNPTITNSKDLRIRNRYRDAYRVPEEALSDSEAEDGGRRDRNSYRGAPSTTNNGGGRGGRRKRGAVVSSGRVSGRGAVASAADSGIPGIGDGETNGGDDSGNETKRPAGVIAERDERIRQRTFSGRGGIGGGNATISLNGASAVGMDSDLEDDGRVSEIDDVKLSDEEMRDINHLNSEMGDEENGGDGDA